MNIDVQDSSIHVVRQGRDVVVTVARKLGGPDSNPTIRRESCRLCPTHAMIMANAIKEYANDARKQKR